MGLFKTATLQSGTVKDVVHFKLSAKFYSPFEILKKIGTDIQFEIAP
jgi:hypothetical protein